MKPSAYKMPVCRKSNIPPPQPKLAYIPIDLITLAYQLKDEPINVNAIKSKLNTEFRKNAPHQKGIVHKVCERPGKKYLQKSPELQE